MKITQTDQKPIPPLNQPPQTNVPAGGAPQYVQSAAANISQPATPAVPKPKRKIPWGYIIVGAIILILIGVGALSFGTINISPEPDGNTVSINGNQTSSTSIKKLPGTYTIKIEKDGYLTYEKGLYLGFHGALDVSPVLKELPVASVMSKDAKSPLTAVAKSGGVKFIDKANEYLMWSRQKKDEGASTQNEKLNLETLPGIISVQYPENQEFALIERKDEIGILDFARNNVTSQDYTTYGTNITSIALSADGEEVFYWQYDPKLKKNYLIRNNITNTASDRYFDQPLLDELELTDPILHWSLDNKYVLAIEKKVVLIDIVNRQAKIVQYSQDITDAWLTADDNTLVAITEQGKLVTIDMTSGSSNETSDNNSDENTGTEAFKAVEHDISTTANRIVIKDNSTALILTSDNKLIEYNFDEKTQIEYLLDESLSVKDIKEIVTDFEGSLLYFIIGEQVYIQELVSASYE